MHLTSENFKNMQTMVLTYTYEILKKVEFNKFLSLCNIQSHNLYKYKYHIYV